MDLRLQEAREEVSMHRNHIRELEAKIAVLEDLRQHYEEQVCGRMPQNIIPHKCSSGTSRHSDAWLMFCSWPNPNSNAECGVSTVLVVSNSRYSQRESKRYYYMFTMTPWNVTKENDQTKVSWQKKPN